MGLEGTVGDSTQAESRGPEGAGRDTGQGARVRPSLVFHTGTASKCKGSVLPADTEEGR